MSQTASPFDLNRTMSASDWRPGSSPDDDLVQLVHLEPVEQPALDGLDQVARLEPRVLLRVAADEVRALDDDVVELALARMVRAGRAHERALAQPVAAQDRIPGGRDRDDDVLRGGLRVRLGRLGADLGAEGLQALGRPAVGDDALDRRQRCSDRLDLRLGLPAAADHAERAGALPGEVLGGDAARRTRPPLAGRVRLEHGGELTGVEVEQRDGEDGAARRRRCRP